MDPKIVIVTPPSFSTPDQSLRKSDTDNDNGQELYKGRSLLTQMIQLMFNT